MPIVQISQRRHKTDALPCPAPRTDLRTQIRRRRQQFPCLERMLWGRKPAVAHRLDVSADRFKDGTLIGEEILAESAALAGVTPSMS